MTFIDSLLAAGFQPSEWISVPADPVAVGMLIALKPSSITITRVGTAQTVRIEEMRQYDQSRSTAGSVTPQQGVIVLGYKDHPIEGTTDILVGDRFYLNSQNYEVEHIAPEYSDRVLAYARVRQ